MYVGRRPSSVVLNTNIFFKIETNFKVLRFMCRGFAAVLACD